MKLQYLIISGVILFSFAIFFSMNSDFVGKAISGECSLNEYGIPTCDGDTYARSLPKSGGTAKAPSDPLYSCDLTKPTNNYQTEDVRICDFDLVGGKGTYGAGSTLLFDFSYISLNSPDNNLYTSYDLFLKNSYQSVDLEQYMVKDEIVPAGGGLINGDYKTFYRRNVRIAYPTTLEEEDLRLTLNQRYNSYTIPTKYWITTSDSDYVRISGDDDSSNIKLLVIGSEWEDEEYYLESVREVIDVFLNDEPIIKNYAPSITVDAVMNEQVSCWSCEGSTDGNEFCNQELLTVNGLSDAVIWFGYQLTDVLLKLNSFGITSLDELVNNYARSKDEVFFCDVDSARSIAGNGPKDYDHIVLLAEYDEFGITPGIINAVGKQEYDVETIDYWRSHVGTPAEDASQNARCALSFLLNGKNDVLDNCPNTDIIFQAVKNGEFRTKDYCEDNDQCVQRINPWTTGRTLIHEFGHSLSGVPDAYTHDDGCVDYRGMMCNDYYDFGNKDFFGREFLDVTTSGIDVSVSITNYSNTTVSVFESDGESGSFVLNDAINVTVLVTNKKNNPINTGIYVDVMNTTIIRTTGTGMTLEPLQAVTRTYLIHAGINPPLIIISARVTPYIPLSGEVLTDEYLLDNTDMRVLDLQGDETLCTDPDGENYFTQNYTLVQSTGVTEEMYQDRCNDALTLIERTCTNGDFSSELVPCDYGCLNGACLSAETPNYAIGAYHMINQFNEKVGDLQSLHFYHVYPNPSNGHCSGALLSASYKANAKQPSYVTMKIFNTAGRRVNEWASTHPIPFEYNGYATPDLNLWIGNPSGHDPDDFIIGYGWPGSDINNVQVAFDVYWYRVYQGNLEASLNDLNDAKFTFNNRNINYDTAFLCKDYFPLSTPQSSSVTKTNDFTSKDKTKEIAISN